jgi:hypothetical protein
MEFEVKLDKPKIDPPAPFSFYINNKSKNLLFTHLKRCGLFVGFWILLKEIYTN